MSRQPPVTKLDTLDFRDGVTDFPRRDGSKVILYWTSTWQRRLRSLWAYVTGIQTAALLDFPDTADGAISELEVPMPGVILGHFVAVAPQDPELIVAGSFYRGTVTANSVVTIQFVNLSGGNVDPPEGRFLIKVTAQ